MSVDDQLVKDFKDCISAYHPKGDFKANKEEVDCCSGNHFILCWTIDIQEDGWTK